MKHIILTSLIPVLITITSQAQQNAEKQDNSKGINITVTTREEPPAKKKYSLSTITVMTWSISRQSQNWQHG